MTIFILDSVEFPGLALETIFCSLLSLLFC